MAKTSQKYLDTEAMKLGYQLMLEEVKSQLDCFGPSDAIRAVFVDRKAHIEKRLEELK